MTFSSGNDFIILLLLGLLVVVAVICILFQPPSEIPTRTLADLYGDDERPKRKRRRRKTGFDT